MTKDLLAAYRYARALFELANEQGEDEHVEAELEALSAALKASPAVERFLSNPALGKEEKRSMIGRIFHGGKSKIDEVLVNFLSLLFSKNRFYLIHDVAAHYRKIADESQGQGVTEIRSATPLSAEQQGGIVSRIQNVMGKKMTVHASVDASLLGGVVLNVGNKVIDDTVSNKIQLFKKELTKIQSI